MRRMHEFYCFFFSGIQPIFILLAKSLSISFLFLYLIDSCAAWRKAYP